MSLWFNFRCWRQTTKISRSTVLTTIYSFRWSKLDTQGRHYYPYASQWIMFKFCVILYSSSWKITLLCSTSTKVIFPIVFIKHTEHVMFMFIKFATSWSRSTSHFQLSTNNFWGLVGAKLAHEHHPLRNETKTHVNALVTFSTSTVALQCSLNVCAFYFNVEVIIPKMSEIMLA